MVIKRTGGIQYGKLNVGETIFFILIILLSSFVLLFSPLFEIKEVEIKGNKIISSEDILRTSGITAGINIFKIDLRQVAVRLKAIPMVKEVDINRQLPSKVVIKVKEREVKALLPVKKGFIAIDADGVYCRDAFISEQGLPVITGIPVSDLQIGKAIENKNLAIALKVVDSLPSELVHDLSEVSLIDEQIILYTLEGIECRLGHLENLAKKGDVIVQVLDKLKGKRIEYIDLSLPGSPVVKYEEG